MPSDSSQRPDGGPQSEEQRSEGVAECSERSAYVRPQILSREPLEAIAAVCTGGGLNPPKATPGPCGVISS